MDVKVVSNKSLYNIFKHTLKFLDQTTVIKVKMDNAKNLNIKVGLK